MALVAGGLQMTVQARIAGAQINPQGNAATVTLELPTVDELGTGSQNLTFGVTSGKGNIYCAGDFDIPAHDEIVFDLLAGTDFKDVFGGTAAFAKLKSLFVGIIAGGDTDGVVIGDAATDPIGLWFGAPDATWKVYPGGPPFIGGQPAGVTVDGSAQNLRIANASAVAATVRIILSGSSS